MNEKELAVRLFEGIDALTGSKRSVDALYALECFLDVFESNPAFCSDELGISIKDLCLIAGYLEKFCDGISPLTITYDPNDVKSTFKAASMGNDEACLNMFMYTISEPSREYDHIDELLTNENLGGYYLLKGIEYGSLECKYRLALALLLGEFGITDPAWSLELLNELKEARYDSDLGDVDELYRLGLKLYKKENE